MDDQQKLDIHKRDYEQYVKQIEGTSEDSGLHTGGLLQYPLHMLIVKWLEELKRLGLAGSKDGGEVDVPLQDGYYPATTHDGRNVLVLPDAYRDEDGYPRSNVRDRHSRTDGAILAMLAVLEGGETVKGGKSLDESALRKAYEEKSKANERLLLLSTELAQHFHPGLNAMSGSERREKVVGFAMRISEVAKAVRKLQEYAELGRVSRTGDPVRDVAAAELKSKGLTTTEIGELLSIPKTKTDEFRLENQNARKAADRGKHILKQKPE